LGVNTWAWGVIAAVAGLSGEKGSISEGKLADPVRLSKDPFTIPPREILDTKPVVTIVGGRIVHEQ
jgi:predicted amidohydrolase YtcJ